MRRFAGALILGLAVTAAAQAHFVFVVPQAGTAKVQIIFSDSLEPDANVPVTKIKNTRLTLRAASGKESALNLTEDKTFYVAEVPGKGNRVVYGQTDYGVLQKGDDKPFQLKYFPKAILGGITADTQKIGEAVPVEIVPVVADGKIRFQFLANGKAAAEAEINVMVPKEKSEKLTTDREGFTKAFAVKGTYGVWARHSETKFGEVDGKKFAEIRRYATLVVDFAGK